MKGNSFMCGSGYMMVRQSLQGTAVMGFLLFSKKKFAFEHLRHEYSFLLPTVLEIILFIGKLVSRKKNKVPVT